MEINWLEPSEVIFTPTYSLSLSSSTPRLQVKILEKDL